MADRMKTAYIYCKDHHDPIWHKSFEEHFRGGSGEGIRSYSEREELQFDRWFDMLPGTPGKYEIEQTCTIKKYLERNPERVSVIKSLVDSGTVDFLGGGETVIDYNLVHGESIYRNFFYSFKWLAKTFGVRPLIASMPDTFGLSAQLPQILNQFGMSWMPIYSRMFGYQVYGMEPEHVADEPVRPYWRGIDGSLVCIKFNFEDVGIPNFKASLNAHQRECPECRGEGCRCCDYSGLDCQVELGIIPTSQALAELAGTPVKAGRIFCATEETIKTASFFADTSAVAAEAGIEPCFVNHRDTLSEDWVAGLIAKLAAGEVTEEEIDCRTEPNPIANGCYTSRSVLKRWNRELEHMLLAAEKFAAFASLSGFQYPEDGFERLWNLMGLIQFHDSITGSHSDGVYAEVEKLNRWVRRGAGKRLLRSCAWIGAQIAVDAPEHGVSAAVFNPLNWAVRDAPAEMIIPENDLNDGSGRGVDGWRVRSADGTELQVTEWKRVTAKEIAVHRVNCRGLTLPPCGYTTVTCEPVFGESTAAANDDDSGERPSDDPEIAGLQEVRVVRVDGQSENERLKPIEVTAIENARYRVTWNERGLTGVFDKSIQREVLAAGSADLWARDDIGSHWETLKFFDQRVNLNRIATIDIAAFESVENAATPRVRKVVINGRLPKPHIWDLPVPWEYGIFSATGKKFRDLGSDEVDVGIHTLEWTQELWLYEGSDRIELRFSVQCDSENIRLFVPFHFGFETPEDRALYEIPYGILERQSYRPKDGVHCNPDGTWPAVHWAAAENRSGGYTCAVLNRGIPAYRFHKGIMEVTLLRSPRIGVFFKSRDKWKHYDPLLKDTGLNVFDLAFTSGAGGVAANRLVHKGYEFNTEFPAVSLAGWERNMMRERFQAKGLPALPPEHSFLSNAAKNVIMAAVKRSEDGSGFVVRMNEAYGISAADHLNSVGSDELRELDPMEETCLQSGPKLTFRPFEIKTVGFRLSAP